MVSEAVGIGDPSAVADDVSASTIRQRVGCAKPDAAVICVGPDVRRSGADAGSVQVEGLVYAYKSAGRQRVVLDGGSCSMGAGEIVMITGPSGSGKTTLLSIVGALRPFTQGSVRLQGRELRGLGEAQLSRFRQRVGFVFQHHNLLSSLSLIANVESGLHVLDEHDHGTTRHRAQAMLDAVGLGDRADDFPDRLSGGEQQRVAVARALARTPSLIIADEPTASLDAESGRTVMRLLRQLANKVGSTVLVSSHDERIVAFADRRLHMQDGHIVPCS